MIVVDYRGSMKDDSESDEQFIVSCFRPQQSWMKIQELKGTIKNKKTIVNQEENPTM